jgi:hypothetical protein
MGLRDLMLAVMLRLDLDQECYNFHKWWTSDRVRNGNYDYGNTSLPYLDLREADTFEKLRFFSESSLEPPYRYTTPQVEASR